MQMQAGLSTTARLRPEDGRSPRKYQIGAVNGDSAAVAVGAAVVLVQEVVVQSPGLEPEHPAGGVNGLLVKGRAHPAAVWEHRRLLRGPTNTVLVVVEPVVRGDSEPWRWGKGPESANFVTSTRQHVSTRLTFKQTVPLSKIRGPI